MFFLLLFLLFVKNIQLIKCLFFFLNQSIKARHVYSTIYRITAREYKKYWWQTRWWSCAECRGRIVLALKSCLHSPHSGRQSAPPLRLLSILSRLWSETIKLLSSPDIWFIYQNWNFNLKIYIEIKFLVQSPKLENKGVDFCLY